MISRLLFLIGIVCLGIYGFFTVQAYFHQSDLEREFRMPTLPPPPSAEPTKPPPLKEGALFGRLEIPRLNVSVMVMEGDKDSTLELGVGHIPGTPLAIAGHRDTFFRPLKDIRQDDIIRFSTKGESAEYQVTSTRIVGPKDTWVLDDPSGNKLTLVTCYPFYYIGPAPKRFVVEAIKK